MVFSTRASPSFLALSSHPALESEIFHYSELSPFKISKCCYLRAQNSLKYLKLCMSKLDKSEEGGKEGWDEASESRLHPSKDRIRSWAPCRDPQGNRHRTCSCERPCRMGQWENPHFVEFTVTAITPLEDTLGTFHLKVDSQDQQH